MIDWIFNNESNDRLYIKKCAAENNFSPKCVILHFIYFLVDFLPKLKVTAKAVFAEMKQYTAMKHVCTQ